VTNSAEHSSDSPNKLVFFLMVFLLMVFLLMGDHEEENSTV
jgi:uncharacterized membrane protein YtjA (UPF0391 family)